MSAADAAEAQKRRLDEDDALKTGKRSAPEAPELGKPQAPLMRNEDFSPELLRIYYDKLFPFFNMHRWLRYGNDPKSASSAVQKDYFLRREFTFVMEGDIFQRYRCFRNAEEFRAGVIAQQPVRMEIGAVFTHPPKNHTTVVKDAYKPIERELVFDIDMDDYDEIRTCCQGSKLCSKCWTFMKVGIKTLERSLREDFGFQHMMFVFSGRRGVHCWVCDKAARQLSNEHRSAVADYLTLVAGGTGRCKSEFRTNGADELHPSIQEAYKICEHYFRDDPNGVLQAQDILNKDKTPHLANIMETLSISERETISRYCEEHPQATSRDIWLQLEKLVPERAKAAATYRQKQENKAFLKDIVIQFTYPRLDVNVSKQMNHLLKSPFVVHPKTGRVCVPINPQKLDNFDPMQVPTIGRLVEELNRTGDAAQTSLKEHTHFFEVGFLQPLERECLEEMRGSGMDMSF
uniref:DNA primase n=1 Tax=Strombidinopsis acuminata TaxID=141414 RepID=A0A7S3T4L2_9SPIT|mmetsp:Transcript_97024/g.250954  ORF Transcript_97024/g.250954 Transcript_97024/m.250954 type:complete len:460 (+) Transcript_97024:80-1459(+)